MYKVPCMRCTQIRILLLNNIYQFFNVVSFSMKKIAILMSLLSVCVIQAHPRRSTGKHRVKQERTVIAQEAEKQFEPEFYTERCELVQYPNNFSRYEIVRVPAPRPQPLTLRDYSFLAVSIVLGGVIAYMLPRLEFKICGPQGCQVM